MKDLSGKVAVVTGAGSGLGAGIAEALAEAGAHIVIADIERDRATEVADRLARFAGRTLAAEVDVTDEDDVLRLSDLVFAEFGAVHVLCNNAGVLLWGGVLETPVSDWQWMFAVNLFGVLHGVKAFVPRMREQGEPCQVVNTISLAAFSASAAQPAYAASKFACTAMTEALRKELADTAVGVSGLYPGGIVSRIGAAQRNRRPQFGAAQEIAPPATPQYAAAYAERMEALDAGRIVRQGILDGSPWIFTHPHWVKSDRWEGIAAAASDAIAARRAGNGPPLPGGE